MRAVYSADPLSLRHELDLSNWQIDQEIPADAFTSEKAKSARADEVRQAGACVRAARPEAAREREAAQGRVRPAGSEVTVMRLNVMKAIVVVTAALLVGVLRPDPADAWATANRWGGSTSHS